MIYWLPWGDRNIASSRLRVHQVASHIPNSSFQLPVVYQQDDVLICQKNPSFYSEMKKAQSQGAKVIYDIDDNYFEMSALRDAYYKISKEANKIVVGAPYLQKYCENSTFIPDTLDRETDLVKKDFSFKGNVGWFGYGNNAHYLNQVMPSIIKAGYRLKLIASPDALKYISNYDKYVDFVQWSLDTVDESLLECDVCVFPLDVKDVHSQAKGEHKVMKTWSLGIPVIAAKVPMYEKIMAESGINCIANDASEWTNLLNKLRSDEFRKQISDMGIGYVQRYYEINNPIDKWKDLLEIPQ